MATILRSADVQPRSHVAPMTFDDIAAGADEYLARVRAEAADITAQARAEADNIRLEAARAGCKAAMEEVEGLIAANLSPAVAALREVAAELQKAKQAWVMHWEADAVRLASAIAAKIIRRELRERPDITLDLVREALELAAGSPNVRLSLNPEDYKSLGLQVRTLVDAMSSLGDAEVTPDPGVSRGGCRVETRFGVIDQQIESQLKRIEEELIA